MTSSEIFRVPAASLTSRDQVWVVDAGKLRPMLATATEEPFSRAGWLFELKYDGVRTIALKRGDEVRLYARSGRDCTDIYPEIARAAIDCFVELAIGKLPRFSGHKLRDRPFAQRAVARAEVRLRAARALVFERVADLWGTVVAGGQVPLRDRALFQIACSDAAAACAEAVDTVAEAAGTSANFVESPLERHARDARVIRQHVTVAPHHVEDGGRVLLGLDPQAFMLTVLR